MPVSLTYKTVDNTQNKIGNYVARRVIRFNLYAPAGCLEFLISNNDALVSKSQLSERSEFCDFEAALSKIA